MKRKFLSLVIILLVLTCVLCSFAGCKPTNSAKAQVLQSTENILVINVTEVYGEVTLLDVMNNLKEQGEIDFTIVGGMIVSVNGVENTPDYSACWMLYTSDSEMANIGWGTIEYQNSVYGSAIVGADSLPVIVNGIYIINYQIFTY